MKKFIYAVCMSLVFTGCIHTEEVLTMPEQCQDATKLLGKVYSTRHENGTPITLTFKKDSLSVVGKVVNQYFSTYYTKCNEITFENIGSTKMLGNPIEIRAEDDYLQWLSGRNFTYLLQDNQLILIDYTLDVSDENRKTSKAVLFTEGLGALKKPHSPKKQPNLNFSNRGGPSIYSQPSNAPAAAPVASSNAQSYVDTYSSLGGETAPIGQTSIKDINNSEGIAY